MTAGGPSLRPTNMAACVSCSRERLGFVGLDRRKQEEESSECEAPREFLLSLFALLSSSLKLSVKAELEVLVFDLYPRQTTALRVSGGP